MIDSENIGTDVRIRPVNIESENCVWVVVVR